MSVLIPTWPLYGPSSHENSHDLCRGGGKRCFRRRFDFSLGRIGRTSGKVILRAGLQLTFLSPATSHRAATVRPCLEAENFEYSNRLAYPFKCTGRRPECFISGGRKNEYAPFCIPSSPAIIFCLSVVSHFLKLRGLPPRIKVDSLCVVAIAIKFLLNIIETNTPVGGLPFLNR